MAAKQTIKYTRTRKRKKVRALKSVPLVDGFWAKNNGRWH